MGLPFVAYHELDGRPNVVVDGAGTAGTRLTLSHWPHSGTPASFAADVSAEIVFRYLDRPDDHVVAEAVSNSHFDEDGLMSVFAIAEPEAAGARRELLIDVANAGDFATFRTRDAAHLAFAISRLADPEESPLDPAVFAGPYADMAANLYSQLLPRVPELLDRPDRARALWADEDADLDASERALQSGVVTIREVPEVDLAIVDVDESFGEYRVHRFTQGRRAPVHPMAVHAATDRCRVMYRHGRRYHVEYRYETWVQFRSRPLMPRADLTMLAARLTQLEGAGVWRFDGVDAITPALHLVGAPESTIDRATFANEVTAFLRTAPPAWDPYDAISADVGATPS